MKKIKAPELDGLLRIFELNTFNTQKYDSKVKEKLNQLYELLDRIKPLQDDDLKILYFSVEKGTIEESGYYEELKKEGYLSNYQELEETFKNDYPDDIYWYRMMTNKYKNYRSISINYRCIINVNMDDENDCFENTSLQELLDFLIYKVSEIIKMLEDNKYNDYIAANLPYKNRFGVIKRRDYWELYPEAKQNMFDNISKAEIDNFIANASESVTERIINMTAGKYFECVRLAYLYNDYDIGDLSDKELYLKYADGRDEGLSKIKLNSSKAFDNWYKDRNRFGGHPWEIMRGHSFYRVNLYVFQDDNGYYLSLDGSCILRKIEIARIYLALTRNNIPVRVRNVDVIKNALEGSDYLGIVPADLIPITCDSYFKKYNPKEFIHLEDEEISKYVIWQEVEKIYLK